MNFSQITDLAIGKILGPSEPERQLSMNRDVVKAFVNAGYHQIERAAMWKFSEAQADLTFAASSETPTSTPTDISITLTLYDADRDYELAFHDGRQAFPTSQRYTGAGAPVAYSIWADELRVHPAPSSETVLNLRYYARWADLVDNTDEPVIPVMWHELLADYAAAKLALRLPPRGGRDLAESQARPYEAAFQQGLAEMLASPHVMVTGDIIHSHALLDTVDVGHGVDW